MRTRFAPTPSGFLHPGNLLNAELTIRVARELGLEIMLRIDDADAGRTRQQYLEDIFRVVTWLDMPIAIGPKNISDITTWSQLQRLDLYRTTLTQLADRGAPLFVCQCSRTEVVDGRCVQGCAGPLHTLAEEAHTHVVRLRTSNEDVVLWGRFGPAYHLASVADDAHFNITHVIRGIDLDPSTQIHREITHYLGINSPAYAHHALVVASNGAKLSKSQGTAQLELSAALRQEISDLADSILPQVLAQLQNAD